MNFTSKAWYRARATALAVGACLLLMARPAQAQVFRAFMGPTADTGCGTFGEGPRELLVGGSFGVYRNGYTDFQIGGLFNRCLNGKQRVLTFVGMHLFPIVIHQRLWIGVAVNADVDFAEMQRSLGGTGDGSAYFFLRPEFATRIRVFNIGRLQQNSSGTWTPDGVVALETHIGYFQAKSLYFTLGMAINLNR